MKKLPVLFFPSQLRTGVSYLTLLCTLPAEEEEAEDKWKILLSICNITVQQLWE